MEVGTTDLLTSKFIFTKEDGNKQKLTSSRNNWRIPRFSITFVTSCLCDCVGVGNLQEIWTKEYYDIIQLKNRCRLLILLPCISYIRLNICSRFSKAINIKYCSFFSYLYAFITNFRKPLWQQTFAVLCLTF